MRYLPLFLTAFVIIAMTEGCGVVKFINDPVKGIKELIVGKPKPPPVKESLKDNPENMTKEEVARMRAWCARHSQPTVIMKFRSLLGLGVTAGSGIMVASILLLIFAKGLLPKKTLITGIGVGLVLIVLSILLDKYLQAILIISYILMLAAVVIWVRKHWSRLKKWSGFTEELKKQGHLDGVAVDAIAHKTIGNAGSKDREALKTIKEEMI